MNLARQLICNEIDLGFLGVGDVVDFFPDSRRRELLSPAVCYGQNEERFQFYSRDPDHEDLVYDFSIGIDQLKPTELGMIDTQENSLYKCNQSIRGIDKHDFNRIDRYLKSVDL